jgi:hypothetical protein
MTPQSNQHCRDATPILGFPVPELPHLMRDWFNVKHRKPTYVDLHWHNSCSLPRCCLSRWRFDRYLFVRIQRLFDCCPISRALRSRTRFPRQSRMKPYASAISRNRRSATPLGNVGQTGPCRHGGTMSCVSCFTYCRLSVGSFISGEAAISFRRAAGTTARRYLALGRGHRPMISLAPLRFSDEAVAHVLKAIMDTVN